MIEFGVLLTGVAVVVGIWVAKFVGVHKQMRAREAFDKRLEEIRHTSA